MENTGIDISDYQKMIAKRKGFSRQMQRMRRKELRNLRRIKKGLIVVVIVEAVALGYLCYKSIITSRAGEPTRIEQNLDGLDGLEYWENQKETLTEYPPLSIPSTKLL